MSVSSCSSNFRASLCHVVSSVSGSRFMYISNGNYDNASRQNLTMSLAKSVDLDIMLTSSYEHPIEGSISFESTGGTSCITLATLRQADLPRASLTRKNLETNSMTWECICIGAGERLRARRIRSSAADRCVAHDTWQLSEICTLVRLIRP